MIKEVSTELRERLCLPTIVLFMLGIASNPVSHQTLVLRWLGVLLLATSETLLPGIALECMRLCMQGASIEGVGMLCCKVQICWVGMLCCRGLFRGFR